MVTVDQPLCRAARRATLVPRYAGPDTFARLPSLDAVGRAGVALVGIPFDSGVSYRPGARFGPAAIRAGSKMLRPYHPALDIEPWSVMQVADAGDLAVNPFSIADAISTIAAAAQDRLLRADHRLIRAGRRSHHRPAPDTGHVGAARTNGAGPFRRPPGHLGHLFRRAVYARHSVPSSRRGGPCWILDSLSAHQESCSPLHARSDPPQTPAWKP